MKFLCGNCKAKYQIADAKVAGRTLRMKCRRCGHDILIQGEGGGGQQPSRVAGSTVSMPPSPPRGGGGAKRTPPPVPPPAPSALGEGFRRGLSGPPEVPQRHAAHNQWHVAIHDVPVGPMSREEVARKITAGAAGPQSLCWREGMDDWRPLEDVPELAALLGRGGSRAGLRPAPVGGRMGAGAPLSSEEYDDEFGEPTRVADASMARGLTASSSSPVALAGSHTPPPSVAPEASQPAAQMGGRQQMSPWALIGIGMAIAAGLLGAPVAIMKIYQSPEQPQAAAVAPSQPARVEEQPRQAVPELDVEEPEEEGLEEEPEEAEVAKVKPAPKNTKPASTKKPSKGKELTEEQRKLLERMGGGGSGPAKLGSGSRSGSAGGGGGEPLKASQLAAVVRRNRPGLQRCYETALRATSSSDTVRVNVRITVGMSGTVTRVNASGGNLGGLDSCIEKLVKRWRFPSSSGTTETQFPVLFQPGA